MKSIHAKIELFCTEPVRSIQFYEKLGFELLLQKEDKYATMIRGDFVMSISPVKASESLTTYRQFKLPPYGVEIVLYTDRVKELRAELMQQGLTATEIVLQPWGLHDFRLTDPDGYYIRMSEYPKEES